MIRVRIAPSPTGFAHVGTAYASLFNYAFARKNKGKFILRLEDTDVKRNVPEAEAAIYEGLTWLGLTWDEGPDKDGPFRPYRQSERLSTYKEFSDKLKKSGFAYDDEGAIRFKNPGDDIEWDDLIRGKIKFSGGEVTDFVLLKSDGYPTYNFGVVIDDILMEITHVIRGEEHISNTPRQLALYKVLGVKPPEFAHFSDLRNSERKKLSKRRDPVDLRLYKEQGYLPEALVNFLCLLGWSHPEGKEIFSLDEFVEKFDISRIRPAGPIFDKTKLNWINGEYIRKMPISDLVRRVKGFSKKKLTALQTARILELIRDRMVNLADFDDLSEFFLEQPKLDPILWEDKVESRKHLEAASKTIKTLKCTKEEFDWGFKNLIEKQGFTTGNFFMSLRIAICGSRQTPPITESMVVLGKGESLKRIQKAIESIK